MENKVEMVELITRESAAIATLTNEQLKLELVKTMSLTAQNLLHMAAIIRTLEERGEDLSELRFGMKTYLRKIAYGQMLPESVIRFGEFPALMRLVGHLPLPDQRRLVSGDPVEVAVLCEDGSIDHRLIDPMSLTYPQVQVVFGKDRLRTPSEQISLIQAKGQPKPKALKRARARADWSRGGIKIGKSFVTAGDALAALADLRSPPNQRPDKRDIEDEPATVPVTIGREDHRRLKILAAQSDCTLTELIARGLRAAGLIT